MTGPDAPYRCSTPCDPDCEINGWGCHEAHVLSNRREHDVDACVARATVANLRWLFGSGWLTQLGSCNVPDGCPPMFFAALRRPSDNRLSVTVYGASVPEAAGRATEWARTARAANREPADEYRACHCFCDVAHPGRKGICDTFSVVGTRRVITSFGVRDVPVCGPCALAVGTEPAPPRPEGGWTPGNVGPEIRRLAELAQPLVIRLPPGTGQPDGGSA